LNAQAQAQARSEQPPMQAFFLPGAEGRGQRLCMYHPARGIARGAVLYVHPWAEEMNKARRMAALQARALAAADFGVLQIDLLGCGDSSGDFADASWQHWLDDVQMAAHWLQQQAPGPLWLWGLRAGALLCAATAPRLDRPCHFLFWQPALSGKQLLQQFLRLKAAAGLQHGDAKGEVERARQDLAAGRCVQVAGYALPPALAQGLDLATLTLPEAASRVIWLELSTRADAALLPPSAARIDAWRQAGHSVHAQVVPGPAFWQTQEIEDAPALIAASTAALLDGVGR
jgi:exosortase A-associated hydrolase 2